MALPKSNYSQEVILDDWLNEIAKLVASNATPDCSGSSDVTLTSAQYRCRVLTCTGTLTGNIGVIVPTDAGRGWWVRNATSGAYTLTVKTSAGSGVAIAQGCRAFVYCDGTDVLRLSPDVTSAGAPYVAAIGPDSDSQHTLPNVASDTVALLAATQTLTNKTLTAPVIQGTVGAGTGLTLPTLTASGHLTLADAINLIVNATTGTKIGTATSQKLGFWNVTPIVQPAHADQAAVTLGNTNGAIGGLTIGAGYTQAEIQALRDACETLGDDVRALSTLLHAIRTALVNSGIIKGAA